MSIDVLKSEADVYVAQGSRWLMLVVPGFMAVIGLGMLVTSWGDAPGFVVGFLVCWIGLVAYIATINIVRVPWQLELRWDVLAWRSWARSGELRLDDLRAIERYRNAAGLRFVLADGSTLGMTASWNSVQPFVERIQQRVPDVELDTMLYRKLKRFGYRAAASS